MLKERFDAAEGLDGFIATAEANRELWQTLRARAVASEEDVARVAALPGRWHLLVLLEDWCGDAFNTVPALAALADAAPNLELRVLTRDANPELMDAHLTGTSRSIPVVMVLDEAFREVGWWGPRPAWLQRWVMTEGLALPKEERYREIRRWYARDRGRSTVEEVLAVLERGAGAERGGEAR